MTTQQSGEVLRRDGRDGILPGFDGGIHCPRWLDGWLRMWDGWLQMVVARLCPLMASMAISRLIGYQRRPDSNHCIVAAMDYATYVQGHFQAVYLINMNFIADQGGTGDRGEC